MVILELLKTNIPDKDSVQVIAVTGGVTGASAVYRHFTGISATELNTHLTTISLTIAILFTLYKIWKEFKIRDMIARGYSVLVGRGKSDKEALKKAKKRISELEADIKMYDAFKKTQ